MALVEIDKAYKRYGTVEVLAGLSGGETILAAGNDAVRDGTGIEVVESVR